MMHGQTEIKLKTVVFILHTSISFLYVKTADYKLSIMDDDNRLKSAKYLRCAYVDVDIENILLL